MLASGEQAECVGQHCGWPVDSGQVFLLLGCPAAEQGSAKEAASAGGGVASAAQVLSDVQLWPEGQQEPLPQSTGKAAGQRYLQVLSAAHCVLSAQQKDPQLTEKLSLEQSPPKMELSRPGGSTDPSEVESFEVEMAWVMAFIDVEEPR